MQAPDMTLRQVRETVAIASGLSPDNTKIFVLGEPLQCRSHVFQSFCLRRGCLCSYSSAPAQL